jgi:hypothetical protein
MLELVSDFGKKRQAGIKQTSKHNREDERDRDPRSTEQMKNLLEYGD